MSCRLPSDADNAQSRRSPSGSSSSERRLATAQLVTALRRRAQLGNQWPMLLAGGFSIVAGIAYIILSAGNAPRLMPLVIYTATGGIEFVSQAWLLARRRHRPAQPGGPVPSTS